MEISWSSFSKIDIKRNYLALVCYLERKSVWAFFNFLLRGRSIQGQLKTVKGLVGYSLRLGFFDKKALALSVWEDEESLSNFVHDGEHSQTMVKLKPNMNQTEFVRWNISGSDVPPKWDDATSKLKI